ncbi:YqjF family protein [Aquimarina macrocephali]|uniref:YqjF family protein n=1 Tax=Aquimarina macrocephali TaxID=666563 RepID=UPI003F67791F
MSIKELLNTTEHRPWKIPNKDWKFYQEWNNTIFIHWQVELSELQKFVPKELEIDLFEGKPWISLVAFTMEKIRPKNLPAFPPISNFDEINIRTYVKSNTKTGVYFLSIEGGTNLSCKIAKKISELPYRYSKIKRSKNQYLSINPEFKDELDILFSIGEEITDKSALDTWLTERYALFQDTKKSINEFEIHHLEWPIRKIEVTNLKVNYSRFDKLIKSKPDKIQYSKGVKVIAWGKNKKERIVL